MRVKPGQLAQSLRKNLAPVYLISGDEPQQLGELADAVRQAAKQNDYLIREVVTADKHYAWGGLLDIAAATSLFAEKKLIDLRLPSGTPGQEGAKTITAYCRKPSDDTVLLITAGKISSDGMKSIWVQAIDKVGVIAQVWPLAGEEFHVWLRSKLEQRGILLDKDGLALLADRVEGNLLAAAQEIEKLYALHGSGNLGAKEISHAVADNSRYDVFKLTESALAADPGKIVKILPALRAEGVAPPVVLWALSREIRLVIAFKALPGEREVLLRKNGAWGERRALIERGAKRLGHDELNRLLSLGAQADRQIKGQQRGDPWSTLFTMALGLASTNPWADTTP